MKKRPNRLILNNVAIANASSEYDRRVRAIGGKVLAAAVQAGAGGRATKTPGGNITSVKARLARAKGSATGNPATSNPLRTDPTRTGAMRRAMVKHLNRQFDELARRVRDMVDRQDGFGLELPVTGNAKDKLGHGSDKRVIGGLEHPAELAKKLGRDKGSELKSQTDSFEGYSNGSSREISKWDDVPEDDVGEYAANRIMGIAQRIAKLAGLDQNDSDDLNNVIEWLHHHFTGPEHQRSKYIHNVSSSQEQFPAVLQRADWDCGPACVEAVCRHLGVPLPAGMEGSSKHGTDPYAMVEAMKAVGLDAELRSQCDLQRLTVPAVCLIQDGHWVVVTDIQLGEVHFMDPLEGRRSMPLADFDEAWHDRDSAGNDWIRCAISVRRVTANATAITHYPPYDPALPNGGWPVTNMSAEQVDFAADRAHPNPTEAQRKSGNYRMGHVTVQGLDITIETPKGVKRKPYHEKPLSHHYGYIKRTESEADGDHVDCFIGPNPDSDKVFVVDQVKQDGGFDEAKCLIGFGSKAEAEAAYRTNYPDDWQGFGGIRQMSMEQFKVWLEEGDTGRPIADHLTDKQVDFMADWLVKQLRSKAEGAVHNWNPLHDAKGLFARAAGAVKSMLRKKGSPVAEAAHSVFPDLKQDAEGEWSAGHAGRGIQIVEGMEGGSVRIDFGNAEGDQQAVGASLRKGSIELMHKLSQLASKLGEQGIPISFSALEGKRNVYAKALKRAGFERAKSEADKDIPGSVNELWRPTVNCGGKGGTMGPCPEGKDFTKVAKLRAAVDGIKAAVGGKVTEYIDKVPYGKTVRQFLEKINDKMKERYGEQTMKRIGQAATVTSWVSWFGFGHYAPILPLTMAGAALVEAYQQGTRAVKTVARLTGNANPNHDGKGRFAHSNSIPSIDRWKKELQKVWDENWRDTAFGKEDFEEACGAGLCIPAVQHLQALLKGKGIETEQQYGDYREPGEKVYGPQEHAWLVTEDGTVIDPTESQFHSGTALGQITVHPVGSPRHGNYRPRPTSNSTQEQTRNTAFAFQSSPEKIKAFQRWLQMQMATLLTSPDEDEAWRRYAEAGYKKGAARAFDDSKGKHKAKGQQSLDFQKGTREEFLRSSFAQPVSIERIKVLAGRSFDEMKNVTADMSNKISRALTDGLVEGKHPKQIARDLVREVGLSKSRAELVAQTELIRSHAWGQLDTFKAQGMDKVGVQVEFQSARDNVVCPKCKALQGKVFKIEDGYAVIPQHPRCRCCFTAEFSQVGVMNCFQPEQPPGRLYPWPVRNAHDVSGEKRDEGGRWTAEKKGQTETAAFKEWFAGSKVVDADGKPLVVYHGTTSKTDFNEFRGGVDEYDNLDEMIGPHFAVDKSISESFTKEKWTDKPLERGRLIPVYLSVRNPRVAPQKTMPNGELEHDAYAINRDIREAVFPHDRSLFVKWITRARMVTPEQGGEIFDRLSRGESIGNDEYNKVAGHDLSKHRSEHPVSSYVGDYDGGLNMLKGPDKRIVVASYVKKMQDLGHDGIVYKDTAPDEIRTGQDTAAYIVFHSGQVKSAIGNKGHFDRSDPNILNSSQEDTRNEVKDVSKEKRDAGGKWTSTGGEVLHAAERVNKVLVSKGKEVPAHVKALAIPPGWSHVFVNHDPSGKILARGKDAKGREQKRYSKTHEAQQALAKFKRVREYLKQRGKMLAELDADRKDPALADTADALRVVMQTGARPGSDKDTGATHKSYGITTLEGRHVLEGGKLLRFVAGKHGGKDVDFRVTDPRTAAMLVARAKAAGKDGRLFAGTSAVKLQQYSKTKDGGGLKPKDARTAIGTETAMKEIAAVKTPPKTEKEYRAAVMGVATVVSARLGNTPAIALKSYIDPNCFVAWKVRAVVTNEVHDVSGEPRDANGKWIAVGGKGRMPYAVNTSNDKVPDEGRPAVEDADTADFLNKYSWGYDGEMNAALRATGKPPEGEFGGQKEGKPHVDGEGMFAALQGMFARVKRFPKAVSVVRGIHLGNKDKVARLAAVAEEAMKSKGVLTMPGFISTSTERFFEGDVKFVITAVHGLDMVPYSHFPDEGELLLDHDSKFKVRKVQRMKNGDIIIALSQLPPDSKDEPVGKLAVNAAEGELEDTVKGKRVRRSRFVGGQDEADAWAAAMRKAGAK